MASELRSPVARSDRDDPIAAQLNRDGTARLRFSKPMIELFDELSTRLNLPVAEILAQAVTLFQVAVDAQARGEQLCLVNDELDIVGEINNFGTSSGVRVSSSTDPEGDRDRQ